MDTTEAKSVGAGFSAVPTGHLVLRKELHKDLPEVARPGLNRLTFGDGWKLLLRWLCLQIQKDHQ